MLDFIKNFNLELIVIVSSCFMVLTLLINLINLILHSKTKQKDIKMYRQLLDIQDLYNYNMSSENVGKYFMSNYDDRVLYELSRIRSELKHINDDKIASDLSDKPQNSVDYQELVRQIADMTNIRYLFEMLNTEKEDQYTYIKNVLADIVHTTRNPLSGINAAIMVMKMENGLDESLRETIQDIEKYVEQINANMSAYYKISKISDLNNAENNLVDFEQELINRCDLIAISQGKKVILNKSIQKIELNKNTAQVILLAVTCILENAISYSPDNGTITIESIIDSNELYIISIQNEGPIVDEALMKRIFEQGFSTRQSSGRGLAIAKKCIEEMLNGIILCENIGSENGVKFSIIITVGEING